MAAAIANADIAQKIRGLWIGCQTRFGTKLIVS